MHNPLSVYKAVIMHVRMDVFAPNSRPWLSLGDDFLL